MSDKLEKVNKHVNPKIINTIKANRNFDDFMKINKEYENKLEKDKYCELLDLKLNPMYKKSDDPIFLKLKLKVMPNIIIDDYENIKEENKNNKIVNKNKINKEDLNYKQKVFDNFKLTIRESKNKLSNSINKSFVLNKSKNISLNSSLINAKVVDDLDLSKNEKGKSINFNNSNQERMRLKPLKKATVKFVNSQLSLSDQKIKIISGLCSDSNMMANETIKQNNLRSNSFIKEDILFCKNFNVYGIVDAYGQEGVNISKNIKYNILEFFNDHRHLINEEDKINVKDFKDAESVYKLLKQTDFKPLENTFSFVEKMLKRSKIDIANSGASALAVLSLQENLMIVSIGDCKGVLYKYDGSYEILNKIHDCSNSTESSRVRNAGVAFQRSKTGLLCLVEKGTSLPNISMTRCVGFTNYNHIGIIHSPDSNVLKITKDHQVMVLGNSNFWQTMKEEDIWSFLSQNVVENKDKKFILKEGLTPNKIAAELIKMAFVFKSDVRLIIKLDNR